MVAQPRQRGVQRLLQVIRFTSVFVGAPVDVDLVGDWMPCDLVFVVLESNVTVPVVGHDDIGLVIGQEYAVAATAKAQRLRLAVSNRTNGTPVESGAQAPVQQPCR